VADFSTDYVTLNTMPTVTAASNAKLTPDPDLVGFENSNPVHTYMRVINSCILGVVMLQ
jgi:hypothetical protein